MLSNSFMESFLLFVVLFNPFLMSVYLLELIKNMTRQGFISVITRASFISTLAFALFALTGEALFSDVLQVRFAAFKIFGGIIFLVISLQYVFQGTDAMAQLKGGDPERVAGAVAMPFMIGPGTISASVVAGTSMSAPMAVLCIISAMIVSMSMLIAFKVLHDYVAKRKEQLVERYVEITGRVSALLIGSIALEMIMSGIDTWWANR